ncbi:MAG: D-alanine--D-alanine ligase [Breznakibacter sp.]
MVDTVRKKFVSRKSVEGLLTFIDTQLYDLYPVLINKTEWAVVLGEKKYALDKNDFSAVVDGTSVTFDCAYVTIHGTPGENGLLQGYFHMLGIPHTTCDVLTSAMTFNKFTCNTYLKGFGILVADSVMLRKGNSYNKFEIIEKTGLPCFVKPNAGGSSFGVTKVVQASELDAAIEKAFTEGDEVIVEKFVKGTEITCGLFKYKGEFTVLPITEVVSKNEFFDFEAKYTAHMADEITPARIPEETAGRVRKIVMAIYDILGCKGIVRIDFILSDNRIFLLEVNTTPGMTATSFIPQQIRAAGFDIKEVFTKVIEEACATTHV